MCFKRLELWNCYLHEDIPVILLFEERHTEILKTHPHSCVFYYLITCRNRQETTSGRQAGAMILMWSYCSCSLHFCFAKSDVLGFFGISGIICSIPSLCLILQCRLTAVAVQRERKIPALCTSREALKSPSFSRNGLCSGAWLSVFC